MTDLAYDEGNDVEIIISNVTEEGGDVVYDTSSTNGAATDVSASNVYN